MQRNGKTSLGMKLCSKKARRGGITKGCEAAGEKAFLFGQCMRCLKEEARAEPEHLGDEIDRSSEAEVVQERPARRGATGDEFHYVSGTSSALHH